MTDDESRFPEPLPPVESAADAGAVHQPTPTVAGDTAGASSAAPAPRRAVPRRRRRSPRVVGLILLILLGLLGGIVGYTYFHVRHVLSTIPRSTALLPTGTDRPPVPDGPMSFLILGADKRDSDPTDPGRSDTMMLAYVPKDRKHVYVISITRDMWVVIHGRGYAKINAAYADGGAPLTVQTVEDLFGVGINHVALMDFDGFMKMTDTLGGVRVWNSTAFSDSAGMDCEFPVGWVDVKGDCGLAYVRERHNSPDGDLGRAARQRDVVKAIVGKGLSAGVLANPATANAMLNQVANTFTLDSSFTDDNLLRFVQSLKIGSSSDVRTLQLPIGGYDTTPDGQDINVPDPEQLAELSQALRTDQMDQWWATHDPSLTFTDNPAWPTGVGEVPTGTPSARPRVPTPTAGPGSGRSTAKPSATPTRKR